MLRNPTDLHKEHTDTIHFVHIAINIFCKQLVTTKQFEAFQTDRAYMKKVT